MTEQFKTILLIQFAKWPVLGRVKTRLARSLGDERALEVHKELTAQVSDNVAQLAASLPTLDCLLAFDQLPQTLDDEAQCFIDRLKLSQKDVQHGEDLGARMANHVKRYLQKYDAVVLVGSDCPSADSAYLASAFAALEDHDMVLGPASDGGYVVIGFRRFDDAVFEGVRWGGGDVFSVTLANAKALAWQVACLEERWDVDELEDYQRWQSLPAQ